MPSKTTSTSGEFLELRRVHPGGSFVTVSYRHATPVAPRVTAMFLRQPATVFPAKVTASLHSADYEKASVDAWRRSSEISVGFGVQVSTPRLMKVLLDEGFSSDIPYWTTFSSFLIPTPAHQK